MFTLLLLCVNKFPMKYIKKQRLTKTERFWINVKKTEKCWSWIGSIDRQGSPSFGFNRKKYTASRFSYEIHFDKIKKSQRVLNSCFNKLCVNPNHLILSNHTKIITEQDTIERFFKKVKKTDYCWLWTSAKTKGGYGIFGDYKEKRGHILAHRFSYELHFGKFDRKMFVLHKCDVRNCIRPDHLFLGTSADNTRDAKEKGRIYNVDIHNINRNKTHCIRGHEFNELNTRIRTEIRNNKIQNSRRCLICSRLYYEESKKKRLNELSKNQ